jgi:methionyl aminopeptidase
LNYPHQNTGRPPFPAATCTSVNDEVVHGIPAHRPLAEGDIVSVDTGCRLNGWCGDAAVTYAVGRISPHVQRLLDVTVATLDLAFELMHTKGRWSQIAREMAQFVRDNGYSTVECFVGHGIGRQMHEEPQVPNFLSRSLRGSGDFRIEPGLVIAVEPMVNMGTKRVKMHRDHWTQSTLDRKPSAHFEHTIAVTKDGPRLLTIAPSPEELAGLGWDLSAPPAVQKSAVS